MLFWSLCFEVCEFLIRKTTGKKKDENLQADREEEELGNKPLTLQLIAAPSEL